MRLQYLKVWQTKDFKLVFQVKLPPHLKSEEMTFSKFYLILDTSQKGFGFQFELQKPENLMPQHAFIETLRKLAKTGGILSLSKDNKGSLCFDIGSRDKAFKLLIVKDKPPHFSLVDVEKNISLMRFGQKGTYTKRVSFDAVDFKKIDGLETDFETFLKSLSNLDAESEEERVEGDVAPVAEEISQEQRTLLNRLRRKRKTIRKSFEKAEKDIPSPEKVSVIKNQATFLQQYAYLVKDEDIELKLDSAMTGLDNDLLIPLDPDKNVGQNMEALFKSYKRSQRAIDLGGGRLDKLRKELFQIEQDIANVEEQDLPEATLQTFRERYKLSSQTPGKEKSSQTQTAKPFKTYELASKWIIYVGKGPKENDELTKKAQGHDTWVHSIIPGGAHVIIPRSGQPEKIDPPAEVLRSAAILALHHSKSRDDFSGEVYVTRKEKIKKRKGMVPGLWIVEGASTQYFTYIESELRELLNCLKR